MPAAEPTRAPALHMPCSPDMIDLSRRFSTSTPSAFIATSAMPAVAPYVNSARQSVYRFGASEGRTSASVHRLISPRSAVREPKRWLIRPASGIATDAPIAGKASASPSCPAPIEAWSWIHGTRVANEPVTAPCTANTAATAYRARFNSRTSSTTSPMVPLPLPDVLPAVAVNYQEPCLINR
ncbi:hypothetical protein Save01_08644 [Streptomyces avermitilis]